MMDLQHYPMDSQRCPVRMQSYAYVEQLVRLNWFYAKKPFPITNNPTIKLNDMDIVGRLNESCSGEYPMFRGKGNWSCIQAVIVMKRRVLFHVIQTYLPTGMLVVISWMSFWLDARAAPARISLTITTLLTLTTMSNGARQDLPEVSYIKAIDIWLTACQAFVFSVLLEYTVVSFFINRRTYDCRHIATAREMTKACQNMCREEAEPEVVHWESDGDLTMAGSNSHPKQRTASSHARRLANYSLLGGSPQSRLTDTPLLDSSQQRTASFNSCRQRLSTTTLQTLLAAGAEGGGRGGGRWRAEAGRHCLFCAQANEQLAKRIDTVARVASPALFCCFAATYWTYYTIVTNMA